MIRRAGVVIVFLLGVTACTDESPPIQKASVRPAKIFEVTSHSGADVREFPGIVAAAEVSNLSFRVAGEVIDLPVSAGEQVSQGQLIARLDSRDAENEVRNAQAEFALASSENDRKKSLFDQGIISRSSYDRAYTNFVNARTNLASARDNLSYTVIKAPFDGVIAKVDVEKHEVVQAKQSIATVQGEQVVEVTIQVPENIVANALPESEISDYKPLVVFSSKPKQTYETSFKENSAEANIGTQTYDVTFTLNRPDDLTLLPGMSATMQIDVARITRMIDTDRFVIPTPSVGRVDGTEETYVWLVDKDTNVVEKKSVVLGRLTDQGIEVLSGISIGDRLVAAGISELSDGLKVRPIQRERGI